MMKNIKTRGLLAAAAAMILTVVATAPAQANESPTRTNEPPTQINELATRANKPPTPAHEEGTVVLYEDFGNIIDKKWQLPTSGFDIVGPIIPNVGPTLNDKMSSIDTNGREVFVCKEIHFDACTPLNGQFNFEGDLENLNNQISSIYTKE